MSNSPDDFLSLIATVDSLVDENQQASPKEKAALKTVVRIVATGVGALDRIANALEALQDRLPGNLTSIEAEIASGISEEDLEALRTMISQWKAASEPHAHEGVPK